MMKLSLFSTLIAVATWPSALSAELCRSSCQSALSYVVFEGNNTKPQCTNTLYITSYRACLRQYCPQDARAAYTALGKACKSTFADSAIANITVDLNGLPKITAKDLYKKTPIKHVVALDPTLYTLSSRTITSAVVQERLNIRYGHAMYGFWAVALLVSSSSNLLKHILPKINTTPAGSMLNKRWMLVLSAWLKRHLLIPTFSGKCTASSAGWYTIPPRLQSCTIIAFVAVNIALCVSGYEVFSGNLKRPSIPGQTTRLIGRRTGVVIMANLPLMWTFAMRNNILSWASGWSFATFNTFHRWISRVVMAELIAHAIAYSLSEYYSGGLKKYDAQWPQEYWWWGVVSMIAGSIATASASYPVRQRFYDAFLLGHIMLATMFLIGTWFHISKQDNEFDMYFWPCVAVWALDRALRLGRILMLNRSFGRANIAYDRASDIIHLDVPTRSVTSPQAGTYYYVYLLHGTKFWESHPFTLSSWEATTGEQGGGGYTLKFLIRPLKGFTGRLRDLAVQNVHAENGSKELPQRFVSALVEGPYGHANSVSSYSSALFIVGGSGITVAISHLRSLNDTFNKHQHIATRRVRVVWAVRRLELASDLLQNNILPWLVESSLVSRVDVTFDIFVTEPIAKGALSPVEKEPLPKSGISDEDSNYFKGAKATIESTSARDCSDEPSKRTTAFVQIHAGRPPLRDICLNYTDRFASQGGRVAIVCCGPPAMTDDVRAQAIEAMSTGVDNMDFFPESFSW